MTPHTINLIIKKEGNIMKLEKDLRSTDGITRKFVHVTEDNFRIEGTYVNYFNKHIVCFATQIGCSGRCVFCANGLANRFHRNLTTIEMVLQCQSIINEVNTHDTSFMQKPILFSAMGCGDPLLNSVYVCDAFKSLNAKYPHSKFALATTGRLEQELQLMLDNIYGMEIRFKPTISLHSADDYKRRILLPGAGFLDELMPIMAKYQIHSPHKTREADYNVVLFDGINDSREDALRIYSLLSSYRLIPLSTVKINKYNPVDGSPVKPSQRQYEFVEYLKYLNVNVEIYETNGVDIGAACGQLINY